MRQGSSSVTIFRTRRLRSRKTTSMGHGIPTVWIASHGAIQSPPPGCIDLVFSRPRRRSALVPAMTTRVATVVPRVMLCTAYVGFSGEGNNHLSSLELSAGMAESVSKI